MEILIYFFLDWKYSFCVNLVQNFKISRLDNFEYVMFDGDVHLFCFRSFLQVLPNNQFGIWILSD